MSQSLQPTHSQHVSLEDAYAFLPQFIVDAIEAIPEHIREQSSSQLEDTVGADASLRRAKLAFWSELDRAYRSNTKFHVPNVHRGIMSVSHFRKYVVGSSHKLMYLITPPTTYKLIMEDMLFAGLQFETELLGLPHKDDAGNIDHKLLKLKLDLVNNVKNRLYGLPVARQENVNHNLNQHQKSDRPAMKDIDQKIKELEERESQVLLDAQKYKIGED